MRTDFGFGRRAVQTWVGTAGSTLSCTAVVHTARLFAGPGQPGVLMSSLVLLGLGFTSFRSGEPWLDTDGKVIDAHGGGMLRDGDTFYWYGSQRNGFDPPCCHDGGINVYSSKDLYSWTFEARVLKAFNGSSTGNGLELERPKVVKCASTHQFVMWVRGVLAACRSPSRR